MPIEACGKRYRQDIIGRKHFCGRPASIAVHTGSGQVACILVAAIPIAYILA